MEIVDKTGEPRTDDEIREAIEFLKREIVTELSPRLVFYPTILDALKELLARRKVD